MDEQKLKDSWDKTKACFGEAGMTTHIDTNRATTLDHLAQRYKQFWAWSVAAAFVLPLMIWLNIITPLRSVLYFGYFALAFAMDYKLYQRIRSINVQKMAVKEVIRTVLECRKFHIICIMILVLWAICLVSLLAYTNFENRYFLVGMVCGIIVGLAIGIIKLHQFLADYRDLTKEE